MADFELGGQLAGNVNYT